MRSMSTKPEAALRVTNLAESLRFYTECLGFKAVQQDTPDLALLDLSELSLLLAGPAVADLTPYLSQPSFIFQPGELVELPIRLLTFHSGDVEATRAQLLTRGLPEAQVLENPWGDRVL